MPDYLLGNQAKAYWSSTTLTGGNTSSVLAAANEATNVRDVSLELSSQLYDSTQRLDSFRREIGLIKGSRVSFESIWCPGEALFEAMLDAWLNDSTLAFFFLDQPKDSIGAQGLVGNFHCSWSKTEQLKNIQLMDVSLVLRSAADWYEIPSGSATQMSWEDGSNMLWEDGALLEFE